MNYLISDSAQQRRSKGFQYEQELITKYGGIHGMDKGLDFRYWWTKKQFEPGGYEYDVQESPPPYSDSYRDYFIQKHFTSGAENHSLYYLEEDFIGDEIDAEYIETLLITAKEYGLFTPEALVIFEGRSIITYGPPPKGGKYVDICATHDVASSDVLIGSDLNKDRADIIRRWLKKRAKEFVPPAKGSPAADVRRYFPDVATIHGSTATNANALHQLAVWLLHWAERPNGKRYSLPGRLLEQQSIHANTGKFLKACRRLHKNLLPLTSNEQDMKQLLGHEYSPQAYNNLTAVLKWWAGWIKEQQMAYEDPAGAYLAALRRVPVVEEWENNSPRYTIPPHFCDLEGFESEIATLRRAFEAALPDLPTKKKRALGHGINELLNIDQAGVKYRQEQFERGQYGLNFLPADYLALHFDVVGQSEGFKWQWVSPLFWGGLQALLQYKQAAALAAYEQLAAVLPEVVNRSEVPVSQPAIPLIVGARVPKDTYIGVRDYFHLTPEGIARRYKLSGEARDAAYRQALRSQIGKRLSGEKAALFLEQRSQHKNIIALREWLDTELFYLNQELSTEEQRQLQADIQEETASIAILLPYSDTYAPYFIKKLKAENLLSVSDFLQFTREPWYPGLAGFYLLDKADDSAYFRDIITQHLSQNPEDTSAVMERAIEWLTAEIERLSVVGTNAFRPSFYAQDKSDAAPSTSLDKVPQMGSDLLSPFVSTAFTWEEVDKLAEAVGLIQGGQYRLGIQKKASFTGFIEALKDWELIEQKKLPELHEIFGQHYNQIINTDRRSTTRTEFRAATLRKLATLFPAARPNPTNKPRI